ncbi:contactin-like isoform X2 [Tubulanus polymorphus]
MYSKLNFKDANASCENLGAKMLKVNDQYEHDFINAWLRQNDTQRAPWYTSGIRDPTLPDQFIWTSDKTPVVTYFWLRPALITEKKDKNYLVYNTEDNGISWKWDLADGTVARPYICEVAKSEVSKLVTDVRDWTFGAVDLNNIEQGPHFIQQPKDTFYMPKKRKYVELECITTGNPWPSYKWKRTSINSVTMIEADVQNVQSHYTLTGGKLVIHQPSQTTDTGTYQCIAFNRFGAILSDPVVLNFAYINEFNNNRPSPTIVQQEYGTNLACNPPPHNPVGEYSWSKDSIGNYVRPDLKPHVFISKNGHLYFSRAKFDDAGNYICMINIPGIDGKQSMPIQLIVTAAVANDRPPQIVSGFPTVFPSSPQRGKTVRMECFAYGTETLVYRWNRKGGLPPTARLSDHNRVLIIPNAKLKDQGRYTCTVTRETREGKDEKPLELKLQSAPYFIEPLRDQFIDAGGTIELRCEAESSPSAITYMWYRDAKPLNDSYYKAEDFARITQTRNVLRITNADDKKDSGMYQCMAKNSLGEAFSSAQVNILAFKPTFRKRPMDPIRFAPANGNVTLLCGPEGAPKPKLTWFKDGRQLIISRDSFQKIYQLPNGNIFIRKITQSDGGIYRCLAENSHGSAYGDTQLMILSRTSVGRGPRKLTVAVNETIILPCEAQVHPLLDYTYIWMFNNYELELDDYKTRVKNLNRGEGMKWGYLIIDKIQRNQEGVYRCVVKTTEDEAYAEALITVVGAPGEPVNIQGVIKGPSSVELTWIHGPDNGAPISAYIVEGKSEYMDRWTVYKSNIVGQELIDRRTVVTNLIPNSLYNFRLRAINSYGIGKPSDTSTAYKTSPAKPYIAPRQVGGGGGKVGLLHIKWEPLTKAEQNGPDLNYIVFYQNPKTSTITFQKKLVKGTQNEIYILLREPDNYYRPYNVYVQAVNSIGKGPESNRVVVYSAEGMPQATPNNVRGRPFNESAIEVTWSDVQNTREMMKGVLQGFRINYWKRDTESAIYSKRQTILGNVDSGLIIGLDADTYYKISVQVFNGAGNGPLSNVHEETTWRLAPAMAPFRVIVTRVSHNSVNVDWMGITTDQSQEPLQGYKIRYWTAGESMEKATDSSVGLINNAVVSGLAKDTRYYLRVLGFSLGGDGTMSSPIVQFEIGEYYFWVQGSSGANSIRPLLGVVAAMIAAVFVLLK